MFVHVDDFFSGGVEEFHVQVIISFEKVYPVGAKHKDKSLYLGMMIKSIYDWFTPPVAGGLSGRSGQFFIVG